MSKLTWQPTICVDFDGTLAEHGSSMHIGAEIPRAVEICKRLLAKGYTVIGNTCRGGADLIAAQNWCEEKGLKFHHWNKNPSQGEWTNSPKVFAHIYIDDRNLGCPLVFPGRGRRPYVDWNEVEKLLVRMGVL